MLEIPGQTKSDAEFPCECVANVLREEGGFEYKRAIVEVNIIYHVPESKEYGILLQLMNSFGILV